MEHTSNRLQKHWSKARLFIGERWPKITEVELRQINGDYDTFARFLNEYYNDFPRTEAEARSLLQRFLNKCDEENPEGEA